LSTNKAAGIDKLKDYILKEFINNNKRIEQEILGFFNDIY